MNTVMNYESIFERYGGIMRTCELTREGISYQVLQNLIEQGRVEKIKYGYYQWQDEKAFTEVSVITALFPKAIICDMSAAMYYGYTDRVPGVWHIAVDNKSARNKFKLDFPIIKPHFIETSRLNIGVSEGNIDGITVKIYDRERVVCDCLRHVNTMDGEVFNIVIQRYIGDKKKDAAKLMMYASKLGVEKKARIGILSESAKGWKKELNMISWNGAAEKYDIRDWASEHEKMGKGITLSQEEAEALYELLGKTLKK